MLKSLALGTLAALRRSTWADYLLRVFSIAGLSLPSFWLGVLIVLLLLRLFAWSPPLTFTAFWQDLRATFSWKPVVAYGFVVAVSTTVMLGLIYSLRVDEPQAAIAPLPNKPWSLPGSAQHEGTTPDFGLRYDTFATNPVWIVDPAPAQGQPLLIPVAPLSIDGK